MHTPIYIHPLRTRVCRIGQICQKTGGAEHSNLTNSVVKIPVFPPSDCHVTPCNVPCNVKELCISDQHCIVFMNQRVVEVAKFVQRLQLAVGDLMEVPTNN